MEFAVLDVGCGPAVLSQEQFKYTELVRLDANEDVNPDVVHDITKPLPEELLGRFDLVYMSHVLEHIDRIYVRDVVNNLKGALKDGGELWIMVPSLEWLVETYDPFKGTNMRFHQVLFGGQQNEFDYHKCAFGLMDLRIIFDQVGLITRQAYQTKFAIVDLNDQNRGVEAVQNVIIGMRHDPKPAIIVD